MTSILTCPFLALSLALPAAAQICRTTELTWPDRQAGGRVGESIGLSGDTLAAGGPGVDLGNPNGGAVYVWRELAGVWSLEQKISAPVGAGSTFGRNVTLSGDRLVVGGNPGSNAVWFHRRAGALWTLAGPLTGSTVQYVAYFGWAMASEGEWVAVGAPNAAVPPSTVRTGAVSLFRDQGGVVTEVAVLKPPSLTTVDDIGVALAMRGGVLVVGTAVGSNSASAPLGRAVVYRIVAGQPVLEQELPVMGANPGYSTSALIGSGATFGQVVATDGSRIAVGDHLAGAGTGRVDVWVHQGGLWVHEGFVAGTPLSQFGNRVAIEGDDLVVSQIGGDRVSHFRRVGGSWVLQHTTPTQPSSVFRVAGIALEGGRLALGSTLSLAPLANAGRVALHELGCGSWPYGVGLAGTGGFVPELYGTGCPRVGQPYSIDLRHGLGGSIAVLGAGPAPAQFGVFGGTLWLAPIPVLLSLGLAGGAGVPGEGTFALPLPWAPADVGTRWCLQAIVLDPALPDWFSFSNAVEIVVGP